MAIRVPKSLSEGWAKRMIAVSCKILEADTMDEQDFPEFYQHYVAHCARAGLNPLAPEAAVALLTDLRLIEFAAARHWRWSLPPAVAGVESTEEKPL
jgi:hypothetical protein